MLLGPKLLVTPVRNPSLPVSNAAREGVQTLAPAWKSTKRSPPSASLSRFGVSPRAFVGAQFAPRSPQPQSSPVSSEPSAHAALTMKRESGQARVVGLARTKEDDDVRSLGRTGL